MPFGIINVTSQYAATPVVPSGSLDGYPFTVVNSSETETVYLGDNPSIQSTDATNLAPLGPLNAVPFDGLSPVYAISASGQIATLWVFGAGATNWSPSPIQSAEQILIAGISFTQPATLVAQGGNFGAGSWILNGGNPIVFPSGSSYQIIIESATNVDVFITDVTVNHFDVTGEFIDSESFTVSNWPNNNNQKVMIRGLLRGAQIQVVGTSANATYINTVTGTTGNTVANLLISVYGLAYPLPSSMPKVTYSQNGGVIFGSDSVAVGASTTVNAGTLSAYTGPAVVNVVADTAVFAPIARIQSFTVASGTSALYEVRLPVVTGSAGATAAIENVAIALDNFFHELFMTNTTATAGTAQVNVIASAAV